MGELLQWIAAGMVTSPMAMVLGIVAATLGVAGVASLLGSHGTARIGAPPEDAAAGAPAVTAEPTVPVLPREEAREPAVEPVAAPSAAAPEEPLEVVPPAPPASVTPPAVEPEPTAPPAEPEPAPRASLRERLARTSEALVGRLGGLLGRSADDALFEELEALLFTADLGVTTAQDLLDRARREASGGDGAAVRAVLREAIAEKLRRVEAGPVALAGPPHVVLVLGVNGSGKTTTIGKLAARYHAEGKRVVLGAGDTFRAAAREQLQTWGERVGCEVIVGPDEGDPAAVAFDTVKAASARGADVAIVDTAGRLQTHAPLMEELAKIARVLGRDVEGAPHETLLVLDSNTGQNALSQAREFTAAAPVTGLVLTKLDGTAKGGVIVGLADEFGIPVRYVGVGEGIDDLRDFEADAFVAALFGD